jgi:hypothetical protein
MTLFHDTDNVSFRRFAKPITQNQPSGETLGPPCQHLSLPSFELGGRGVEGVGGGGLKLGPLRLITCSVRLLIVTTCAVYAYYLLQHAAIIINRFPNS